MTNYEKIECGNLFLKASPEVASVASLLFETKMGNSLPIAPKNHPARALEMQLVYNTCFGYDKYRCKFLQLPDGNILAITESCTDPIYDDEPVFYDMSVALISAEGKVLSFANFPFCNDGDCRYYARLSPDGEVFVEVGDSFLIVPDII